MAFTRESLNAAVSLKLADIDTASGMHRALFTLTQAGGLSCAVGAVLIAPLAIEVSAIAGAARRNLVWHLATTPVPTARLLPTATGRAGEP